MASLFIRAVSIIITIYDQRNVTPIRNAIRRETNQLDLPTLNCRSLSKKTDKLECSLKSLNYQFDCIGLTETWLKEMESTDVYNMTGYTFLA